MSASKLTILCSERIQLDDDAPLPLPDFTFDEDGNLLDLDPDNNLSGGDNVGPLHRHSRAVSPVSGRASPQPSPEVTHRGPNQVGFHMLTHAMSFSKREADGLGCRYDGI